MPKKESKEMLDYYTIKQLKEIVDKKYKITLAHKLAKQGDWHTNDKKILKLSNNNKTTVAHYLAQYNRNWLTNDLEILNLENDFGTKVANVLARFNKNWLPYKRYILINRQKAYYEPVAYKLAYYNKKWFTFDIEILNLREKYTESVAQVLCETRPEFCVYNKDLLEDELIKDYCKQRKKYFASRVYKNVITIIPII